MKVYTMSAKQDKSILIRISSELLNRLEKYCKEYGGKKSTVIKTALERFLNEKQKSED
ncbi:hypothetical protein ACFL6I_02585 [candidate division KSB1 bacterium]